MQRGLDPRRQVEIAKYVRESDATFPTSVTLSANSDYVHLVETDRGLLLVIGNEIESVAAESLEVENPDIFVLKEGETNRRFVRVPDGEKVALVIDGQHRIEGLREAGASEEGSDLADFEIPLVFMFELTPELMARIFVTINSNQRRVDPSLLSDLFGLSTRRSPMRTCHVIAAYVNGEASGPFSGGLKMLGRRKKTNEPQKNSELLTQGSFCKYLLRLISNNSEEDERRLSKGEVLKSDPKYPLREFFIDKNDDLILHIVRNFFSAVRDAYINAWETKPEEYLLRKTVGFASLTKLLNRILPIAFDAENATYPAFKRVFDQIKLSFPEQDWAVGKFSSSEADASKVATRLFDSVKDLLPSLLEKQPGDEKSFEE